MQWIYLLLAVLGSLVIVDLHGITSLDMECFIDLEIFAHVLATKINKIIKKIRFSFYHVPCFSLIV